MFQKEILLPTQLGCHAALLLLPDSLSPLATCSRSYLIWPQLKTATESNAQKYFILFHHNNYMYTQKYVHLALPYIIAAIPKLFNYFYHFRDAPQKFVGTY